MSSRKLLLLALGTVGEPKGLAVEVGRKLKRMGCEVELVAICDKDAKFLELDNMEVIYKDKEIVIFKANGRKGIIYLHPKGYEVKGIDGKVCCIAFDYDGVVVYHIGVEPAQKTFREAESKALAEEYILDALSKILNNRAENIAIFLTTGKTGPTRYCIVKDAISPERVLLRVVVGFKPLNKEMFKKATKKESDDANKMNDAKKSRGRRRKFVIVDNKIITPHASKKRFDNNVEKMDADIEDAVNQHKRIVELLSDELAPKTTLVGTDETKDSLLAEYIAYILQAALDKVGGRELSTLDRFDYVKTLVYYSSLATWRNNLDNPQFKSLPLQDNEIIACLIDEDYAFYVCSDKSAKALQEKTDFVSVVRGDLNGIVALLPVDSITLEKYYPTDIPRNILNKIGVKTAKILHIKTSESKKTKPSKKNRNRKDRSKDNNCQKAEEDKIC